MRKKLIVLFFVIGVLIIGLLVWAKIDDFNSLDLKGKVQRSTVIVYAIAKPDKSGIPLIVQQVWKDARKSRITPLIGLQMAVEPHEPGVQIPEGAIIFLTKQTFNSQLEARELVFVNHGKADSMTLEQYKKACGF